MEGSNDTTVAPKQTDVIASLEQCDGTLWNGTSSCSACTTNPTQCVWCEYSNSCVAGSLTGPTDKKACPNNDWQIAKMCFVHGNIVIIVVPTVVVSLVLAILICIYCKCRKRSKAKYAKLMSDFDAE